MTTGLLTQFGKDPLERVTKAVALLKQGKGVVLVDDDNRENEGDVIFAAEKITPEAINLLIRTCSGIICLAITENDRARLKLDMMLPDNRNTCKFGTAFTLSIDAKEGTSTGVSASDRAHTIQLAVNPASQPEDFAKPGHVFPLLAKEGGVLERAGHTEGSTDLMTIAGLRPLAVLCELMNSDGTMARLPEVALFAEKQGMGVVSTKDIIAYRQSF